MSVCIFIIQWIFCTLIGIGLGAAFVFLKETYWSKR